MATLEAYEATLHADGVDEVLAEVEAGLGNELRALAHVTDRALRGSRLAQRMYVRCYRELTRNLLHAAHHAYPDVVVDVGQGQLAVVDVKGHPRRAAILFLEEGAVDALFSAWVSHFGVKRGVFLEALCRVRDILPTTESLIAPRGVSGAPVLVGEAVGGLVWDLDDDALLAFITGVRRELASPGTPLDAIADGFGLNETELGELFGVSRQAIAQWRGDRVPSGRVEKVTRVASLADLLTRKLKRERLPGIARRPAAAYGGLSMLEMIQADKHDELIESVRRSFDPSGTV
jgi:hypothetical protein